MRQADIGKKIKEKDFRLHFYVCQFQVPINWHHSPVQREFRK